MWEGWGGGGGVIDDLWWFQLFAETQILCIFLPRVMVCAPLLQAPSSSWLYAHERETVIMLVQWKQQMKFRIIKKVSSDYSHFYVVETLLLLCAP
jgi:hypothetical protein